MFSFIKIILKIQVMYTVRANGVGHASMDFSMEMWRLWLKFILGLMFFELVSILFAIFPGHGNEYMLCLNLVLVQNF